MRPTTLATLLAVWLVTAQAHNGPHGAQSGAPGQLWDFTLASLDGNRFVRASDTVGPVLVNFWGKDCPPCVAELPRLHEFARANPQWTVLLVSTDSPTVANEFVRQHGLTLPVLRPGGNVSALMRSAGNRSGGLPFTVTLRNSRLCASQSGSVDTADLHRLAQACPAQ